MLENISLHYTHTSPVLDVCACDSVCMSLYITILSLVPSSRHAGGRALGHFPSLADPE